MEEHDIPTPPLGSCINCGRNIFPNDFIGFDEKGKKIYKCLHCSELIHSDEILPF